MVVGHGVKAVTAGITLCLAVAGCTTDPERGSADPSPSVLSSSSAPPEPVSLDVAVYGPEGGLDAYDALADAFMAENPHVTVEVKRFEDAAAVMDAVDGEMPPDVFLMDHLHLPQLVEDGQVQPVDALLEARQVDFGDGYQRGGLTAFAANASLQCMPHDVSPTVVYYNEDLVNLRRLAEEGEEPPNALDGWDWETFARAARLAARGPADGVYLEPTLFSLAPFVWSAGGDIVDDPQAPTSLTLSEGEAREALEQVLALARDPEVTPSRSELRRQDAVTRFARGKLGIILGSRALTPRLREADGLDFDVMPLPNMGRVRTIADMTGYCVAEETNHLQAAGDFVAFAVSRQGAAITTRPGYVVPSNLEVANSTAFNQPAQPESSFVFNEGVRRAQSLPFVSTWPELSEAVEPVLTEMFYAPVIDLEQLLTQVDTTSQRVLAPAVDPEE